MAHGLKRTAQLLAATLLMLAGCGGPGPDGNPGQPRLSPPTWTWQGPLSIPAVADSRYVNLHQQMTYWIWIEGFSYREAQLAWLGDYILQNYQDDFICVQPMVRDTPWGGGWHNGGGGGSW